MFFYAPCFIVTIIVRHFIIHRVNGNQKLMLELLSCLSMVFAFGNCSANAILFLMTNVKAKRLLRNFIRGRKSGSFSERHCYKRPRHSCFLRFSRAVFEKLLSEYADCCI